MKARVTPNIFLYFRMAVKYYYCKLHQFHLGLELIWRRLRVDEEPLYKGVVVKKTPQSPYF